MGRLRRKLEDDPRGRAICSPRRRSATGWSFAAILMTGAFGLYTIFADAALDGVPRHRYTPSACPIV